MADSQEGRDSESAATRDRNSSADVGGLYGDDSMEDVTRDGIYYSDGESSSGSHHEDEPMDQEENVDAEQDRENEANRTWTSFDPEPDSEERENEDSGESESESERNTSSAEPAEDTDLRRRRPPVPPISEAQAADSDDVSEQEKVRQSANRRDFIGYLLSLLRGHTEEHGDDFPVLDVAALRHVAYVADASLYFLEVMAKTAAAASSSETDHESNFYIENLENRLLSSNYAPELKYEDWDLDVTYNTGGSPAKPANEETLVSPGKLRKFFQRSKSILYPGVSLRLGPFDHSAATGLPLAEKPHLLRPEASRQRMFGLQSRLLKWNDHKEEAGEYGLSHPTHVSLCEPIDEKNRTTKPGILEDPGEKDLEKIKEATDAADKGDGSTCQERQSRPQSVIVHASRVKTVDGENNDTKIEDSSVKEPVIEKMDVQAINPPPGVAAITLDELTGMYTTAPTAAVNRRQLTTQKLLGRWKFGLTVLAKVFSEEIGTEPGSILVQMAGFPVRESRFRKEMEKLRNGQSAKDLCLEVDRERHLLVQQTIKQLNERFGRRMGALGCYPLSVHKMKVTFKDEPGEGSGVARSFYAAIAEALLAPERLPNLEHCQVSQTAASPTRSPHGQVLLNRLRQRERQREMHRRRITNRSGMRFPLSAEAPAFFPPGDPLGPPGSGNNMAAPASQLNSNSELSSNKQAFGERLLPKVRAFRPTWANKVTGMLLELPAHQIVTLLTNDDLLRANVEDAVDLILAHQNTESHTGQNNNDVVGGGDTASNSASNNDSSSFASKARKSVSTPNLQSADKMPVLDPDEMVDSAPLFFQPSKTGFFSPVAGKSSPERLNAFRNVGRLIGICLLQNEVLPLHLCRHVLKFVLGRPITWYDLAFFDSTLFESLRSLVKQTGDFSDLHITFSISLSQEEGGQTVELKTNGANIPVSRENVIEYIYRYLEYRMISLVEKPLEAIKQGVFDVLPSHALEGLTAEDLRLLLCGTHDVSPKVLQSYTKFADESSASSEQLSRFKRWFWSVVEKMRPEERQDLVYFWTGSPALPSSEEGFQPLPSVMIRPADDHHLPTANTCISRLYVPLYSSKQVLRQKLLLAIKARNFGFV